MKWIYPDSCTVIYLIEQQAEQSQVVIQAYRQAAREGSRFAITALTRLECRVRPLRDADTELLATYDRFFAEAIVQGVALSDAVFEHATRLRAHHRLRTPDALHLAAALHHGCDEFWTNDQRLANAAADSIRIVVPQFEDS